MDADALPFGAQHRIGVGLDQVLARGHFGDDQAGAERRDQAAERGIGHARHRRKNDRVRHHDIADGQRLRGKRCCELETLSIHAHELG